MTQGAIDGVQWLVGALSIPEGPSEEETKWTLEAQDL